MKKLLMLLPVAAAFSLASCNENKPAETTTTETTTTSTAATGDMDMQYRSRAKRIADKMAADMKITDTAMVSRLEDSYYTRAQRLGDLRTKYTSDTTGMAAAMRSAYSETDTEMKGYLPAETYTAYETSRPTYYEDAYMDDTNMESGSMDNSASASTETSSMDGGEGGKMKVKADGDVKIKDAAGNKAKIDGDDGTVKLKPENGKDVKIK
ncbi:hypothetical protein J0X19_06440 [Hymenobacter sp. BT186]|uniref:Lipoprotein n=1 Tax=Hymenobacter telluris TaxID=2816474 RepID=A0A939EX87_9BACT|nr:hypothetical protein [Hymenobacter telluris]MBO0357578.1 hypothetical protein [Hymenobacter telluris]MBW3373604.1 hypothetical protein [Hymenobacter norwichensis]